MSENQSAEHPSATSEDQDAARWHPGLSHIEALRAMMVSEKAEDGALSCPSCRLVLDEILQEF